MNNEIVGLTAFVMIFGAALAGIAVAQRLPQRHLSDQTRTAVSVSVAIVGTLAALVISLMISSASNTFSEKSHEVTTVSVDLIRMDHMLRRYGPLAADARAKLQAYAAAKTQQLFPIEGTPTPTSAASGTMLAAEQDAILALNPADERQRWLRTELLTMADNLGQTRWMLEVGSGHSIPAPFLVLLVLWLAIVFGSFGLFAPVNPIAIASLFLTSIAVSCGITLILELDSPLAGAPMRDALALITQ